MATAQRTVLITGCSEGGIGDALAREFHRQGLRVFASARSLEKIQHLTTAGIEILGLDVVDKASRQGAIEELAKLTGGSLDILVNNSGVGFQMPLLDVDIDEGRKIFEVNLWGVLAMCQACAPLLRAAAAARGRPATIVNIGSVVSRVQIPWQGIYNASKGALHVLNDTMRVELAPLDIKVLHVVTGGIQTKFYANAKGTVLPDNSIYGPGKGVIEADIAGKAARARQTLSAERYAKKVVRNALKKRPMKEMWLGGSAEICWLGTRLGWPTVIDGIVVHLMGWSFKGLKTKLGESRQQTKVS
ncbi:putative short-chain dehydrogenase/reductase [Xylariaceae sp. FL0016]|nr:putative short-chain dehydrogenase/reductase [Xylariaceae sp. FL0016]